jgi:hypothetical protein
MLRARRFLAERRSVAALEFALILPLMLILLAGVYDITEALIVDDTVTDVANGVVATGSIMALTDHTDNSTALSYDQVQLAESTIWADFPDLRRGQKNGTKSITLSSIDYQPPGGCNSGAECSEYSAYVVWSEAYSGPSGVSGQSWQNNLRTCSPATSNGAELQVAPGTALGGPGQANSFTNTLATLDVSTNASYPAPGDETGPSPILVSDVTFSYTPLFNFYIKSNITFIATAMWPVRSVKNLQPAVNGAQTVLPLAQEFTTILGEVSGSTLTLYNADGTIDSNDPTVPYVGGTGLSGGGTTATFCINTYYTSPYPNPYSAPTPQTSS